MTMKLRLEVIKFDVLVWVETSQDPAVSDLQQVRPNLIILQNCDSHRLAGWCTSFLQLRADTLELVDRFIKVAGTPEHIKLDGFIHIPMLEADLLQRGILVLRNSPFAGWATWPSERLLFELRKRVEEVCYGDMSFEVFSDLVGQEIEAINAQLAGYDQIECHPDAWDLLKAYYLSPEQPSFAVCYRRMKYAAEQNGWSPIPGVQVLRTRMKMFGEGQNK